MDDDEFEDMCEMFVEQQGFSSKESLVEQLWEMLTDEDIKELAKLERKESPISWHGETDDAVVAHARLHTYDKETLCDTIVQIWGTGKLD